MRQMKVTELSLIEAFFTSLVVGLAETYFPAFSLAKGASPIEAGILVSLPMIFAVLFQFVVLRKLKNLPVSTWVPLATGIQVVSLVSLTAFSTFEILNPVIYLLIIYSMYWAGFYSAIPAWNRWVSELVSFEDSQKYFSMRTRVVQVGIVAGLFMGGFLLHFKQLNWPAEYLFASLFAVCASLKFLTFKLFRKQTPSSATIHFDKEKAIALFNKHKTFFIRCAVFNFSVFFSAPFVASYLLSEKKLSYDHFMWVMIGLFAGKILMTLVLSKIRKNVSTSSLLFYGAICSAPLPLLWMYCTTLPLMILLQVVSGTAWACWEVGLSLNFFKHLHEDDKIEVVSIYYLLNVATQVLGTLIGAFILKFIIHENYDMLFVFAGVVRFICAYGVKNQSFGNEIRSQKFQF
ncbi:MAG: MFS transporter [Pseudobdellovibrio sp.]